jgi:hypothetical protein
MLGYLVLASQLADATHLALVIFGSFYITAFVGWQRSSQQAAEDSFLLARGAVTRRGLTAVHFLIDAISIGFIVAAACGIGLWRDPQPLHGSFRLESIVVGATCYSVVAVVLSRWRWSEFAAAFLVVPPGIAGFSILDFAHSGVLPILTDFGFLPSFVRELRAPPLSVGILISILCIAGSLVFPPAYDEPSSAERRDVSPGRPHSTARSPGVRRPLAILVLTQVRASFLGQMTTIWMVPATILLIGMNCSLVSDGDAKSVTHGFFGFMFLGLLSANWAPTLLADPRNQTNTRRWPLEFLLTLPISRRRLYLAYALTLAAGLGLVVVAGLASSTAWSGHRGPTIGRAALAIAAVSLAWVQSTTALLTHSVLTTAATGSQSVVRWIPLTLLAMTPYGIAVFGQSSSGVLQAAMYTVEHVVPISLALCALAVAIHYAACRRFEQLELGGAALLGESAR